MSYQDFKRPDSPPSTSYTVEVTSSEVFKELADLDRKKLGSEDYLGFVAFWEGGDDYKHILREVSAFAKKRIHDALVFGEIPLGQSERNAEQLEKSLQIYKAYL